MMPCGEIRRLEELVLWEVDIVCYFGQCLSRDLVLSSLLLEERYTTLSQEAERTV